MYKSTKYNKITLFTVVILFMFFQKLIAQNYTIQLPVTNRHLYTKYTPFDSIQVLDNRIDNVLINQETGTYPLPTVGLALPVTKTIQEYWQSTTANMQRGNRKLLINIKQMRVPNRNNIFKDYKNVNWSARQYILFSADIYFENIDGFYRKLFSIDKDYFYTAYRLQTAKATSIILNELISTSGYIYDKDILNKSGNKYAFKIKKLMKEEPFLTFQGNTFINNTKDTTKYTMEQINVNTKALWKNYPIMNKNHFTSGVYMIFDDFRNDKLLSNPVQVSFNVMDSTYTFNRDSIYYKAKFPFVICDGEKFYINIFNNKYISLQKGDNTFYFCVPNTLLNMYTMLSLKNNNNYMDSNNVPNTGSILGDLIGIVFINTMSSIYNNVEKKKIMNKSYSDKYRECYIDMDSGDFIY